MGLNMEMVPTNI